MSLDTIHQWIYVIIPIEMEISVGAKGSVPMFSAFCKACRHYFTEVIPTNYQGEGLLSKSTLPRHGCEPISDDVRALPFVEA